MASYSSDSDILSDQDSVFTEEDVSENNYFDQRPVAYAFEPTVQASQLSGACNNTDDERDSDPDPSAADSIHDRLHNTSWCTCGHCLVMTTQTECICCQEFNSISPKIPQDNSCVTQTNSFQNVVINQEVLDITLLMMCDVRAESLIRPIASRWVDMVLPNIVVIDLHTLLLVK